MDLDFDKYCLVDGSPTTVLPAPRCHSKVANRKPYGNPKYVNEVPSVNEDLDIKFIHYQSESCRDLRSQRVSRRGNEVQRRGSIYQSSKEVCLLHKSNAAVERKKIEVSQGTESALSFGIINSLCILDEDSLLEEDNRSSLMALSEQSTSSVYENQVDLCSYDSMIMDESVCPEKDASMSQEKDLAVNLHEPLSESIAFTRSPARSECDGSRASSSKARINHVKKILDPFVISKSKKSLLSSSSRLSSISGNITVRRSLLSAEKRNDDSVHQCSPAHLHGVLKLGTKHGVPFIHFSVTSLENVYVAKTWKAENASTWVYTFHSLPHRKTLSTSGWGSKESYRESSMVGQMHVSCHQYTEFKGIEELKDFMVTEFLLYDIIHSQKTKSSQDFSHDPNHVIRASQPPLKAAKLHPEMEIAAIVMHVPLEKRESLKFKSGDNKIDETPPNLLDLFQLGKATEHISDTSSSGNMHVVIPAGNHGLPVTESCGPSPLLDRWRLGGGCDCGGWDMACSLNVLSNPTDKIAAGQPLIDNQNPTQLFFKGRKDDTPAFTMRMIENGKYAVDFHAQLSTLQAFSISVATLHTAEASTIAGLDKRKQMVQSDSVKALAKEGIEVMLDAVGREEKRKVNRMEEKLQSLALNPPFSPIARV